MESSESQTRKRKTADGSASENRRQRKYRKRRDAIIAAARKVFEQRGYEGASIREIAAEADFAKGSIYYYFENKAALLDAVIGEEIVRISDLHRKAAAAKDENPLGRLSGLVREVLGFYERNFALFRMIIAPPGGPEPSGHSAGSLRKSYLDAFRRNQECLGTLIREAQSAGQLTSAVPADEGADLLQGLIHAEVRRWDESGRKEPLSGKDALIKSLFLNGLGPRESSPPVG